MKKYMLLFLLLAFLPGCAAAPQETPTPAEVPTPTIEPTPEVTPHRLEVPMVEWYLEPWRKDFIDILAEKKFREQAREAQTGNASWEGYYILYDMDKDGFPELLILYWEFGAFYADLYTFTGNETEYVGNFCCGRLPSLYSCPGENGLLTDAARAGPEGETHWWRKFTIENGMMGEEELLWECISWEGEGAYAVLTRDPVQAQELIPGAQILEWNMLTINSNKKVLNIAPILDHADTVPLTPKWAANIYLEFLMGKMPCSYYEETLYHSELYSGMTSEWALKAYHAKDLTGDGIPELYCSGPGVTPIWTIQNRTVTCLGEKTTYEQIIANGGIFYHRPGAAPEHDDYAYLWLSPESQELPEVWFSAYDTTLDGLARMDTFYIDGTEVTQDEWEARTAPYFALRDAEPTEEQKALPFLQWAASVGVTPEPTPEVTPTPEPTPAPELELELDPWQAAYWDILTNPGKYEGFYAVAEHIPSNPFTSRNVPTRIESYRFAVCDVNSDGVQELLLWGDHFLLNILHWNDETGQVEDLDGPRTYPLMDTLGFFDTGYFSTINGAGGLYTEFWHLEDPDPDHYWYGWERTGQFNEEGELISVEEFPFRSSDGKDKFTLQEYYALLGDSGTGVEWLELTPENIRQAFFPTEGEEVAP